MLLIVPLLLLCSSVFAQSQKGNLQKGDYGYLYCHMNDRGRAWTAYALSRDGFHYHDLLQGDSSDPQSESVYQNWATINRVWAPQIVWDADFVWPDGKKGGYMVYYSMWNRSEEAYDRMYYSYADERFTTLTQPRLLFDWGYATIDADINWVPADHMWHMMIKKEGGKPGLFTATAPTLTGPWSEPVEDDYVDFEGNKKCEGVSAFQLAGDSTWVIGYIEYSSKPKNYRLCLADQNMRNFHSPRNIEGVDRPQHGSFLRLTKEEYDRLQKWSDEQSGISQ